MRFLVTAGPTREPIDPVRFLSNRSSGKMGYAIAEAALEQGHDVTIISGPVGLPCPAGARLLRVMTSDEMHDRVHDEFDWCEVLVMCAAVTDYKPSTYSPLKMKKQSAISLELIGTKDILASLPRTTPRPFIVGFAAETNDLEANARKKLQQKNCDLIAANDVSSSDSGIESDDNALVIFDATGVVATISRAKKKSVACDLLKIISRARENCLTKKT